jgi:hypothetical protein
MCKNNQPPFCEGQKIVCISVPDGIQPGSPLWDIEKDEVVTASNVKYGHNSNLNSTPGWYTKVDERGPNLWYSCDHFVPIHPAQSDITAELAKDAVPETLDVIQQPVLS